MTGAARARQSGFTLLEVMVAFVIAALACTALYRAGFTGVGEAATAARLDQAVVRAESHLAAIGPLTPLQPEDQSGDDGGGYRWSLAITAGAQEGTLTLYNVVVVERFGSRQVTLATAKLGPTA